MANLKLMRDQILDHKIIIGITGKNGSGKDTVSDIIQQKYKAKKLVFSDLLKQALKIFIEDIGRTDYSWLGTNLRQRFGNGILSHGMRKKIAKSERNLIVLSGVRDLGELKMIKSFQQGVLIFVDADIKIRWQRINKRDLKADDKVSFDEFQKEKENLPSEKQIDKLGQKADFIINNDGSLKDLTAQIDKVMNQIRKKTNIN